MADRMCSVPGCERPHQARGLCGAHYQRQRKYGDPLAIAPRFATERTCEVDGCDGPHEARGLCNRHYHRLKRHGDVDAYHTTAVPLPERFWAKVDRRADDECWPWLAAVSADGYGRIQVDGQNVHAHRISHLLNIGPIPDGHEVDHLCRVRDCVNPAHLEAVTPDENKRRARAAITHCPAGHPYDVQNTYVYPSGSRGCRACQRERRAGVA